MQQTLDTERSIDVLKRVQPDALFSAIERASARDSLCEAILAPGRRSLTFGALVDQIVELRDALGALGIGPGDRIAAALPDGPIAAATFLSIASCATYAALNPAYTEQEFERYLAVLEPAAVAVPASGADAIRVAAERRGIAVIEVDEGDATVAGVVRMRSNSAVRACVEPRWAREQDVALILLTSGSTARPKLVPMRHRHLVAMARSNTSLYGLTGRDRYLHSGAMFHGHGLKSGVIVPILSGGGVVCAPFTDAASFLEQLTAFQATWYSAMHTTQRAILDGIGAGRDVPKTALRFIVSGGGTDERLSAELEAAFGVPVLNRYSTSETCVLAAESPRPEGRRRRTVGRAVVNEIRVVDASLAALPAGVEGEILARGPTVFDGYLDDAEQNARSFVDGWFRTGDLGWVDDDGFVTITGRLKEIINRGGEKISPTEVERALAAHEAVAHVCVFGIPHPTLGEDVAAAVVAAPGRLIDERALAEFARSRLATFKIPRRFLFTTELPRLATGKIDRRALSAYVAAADPSPATAEADAPADPVVEANVAALWKRLLKVAQVRRDVDFISAGGDSLRMAEMVNAIEDAFDVRTSLRQLADEGMTIAALAGLVSRLRSEQGSSDARAPGVVALKRSGELKPLFAIPGVDGRAATFVHFCRLLDARRPLYGIEARGLRGRERPLERMESIAADNIARIREIQPKGPYHLIGTCHGALVAYEMARQLEADGERVGFLALLDPPPPFTHSSGKRRGGRAWTRPLQRWTFVPRFVAGRARMYAAEFRRLDRVDRRGYVWAKARLLAGLALSRDTLRDDGSEWSGVRVEESNRTASRRYVPGPYGGVAILAFTRDRKAEGIRNDRLDWLRVLPQCGAPHLVAGRDSGSMMSPPNVELLAKRVNEWLAAVPRDG